MSTYPHCKHCCWTHDEHPETHDTPCGSWCKESNENTVLQPDLFGATA